MYVDRQDRSLGGGELPALRQLSDMLGPQVWLNTIIALTHAGRSGRGGGASGHQWTTKEPPSRLAYLAAYLALMASVDH